MLVRNDDRFVGQALRNVLGFCDKVLVLDHASTDHTLERVEEVALSFGKKIEIHRIADVVESHAFVLPNGLHQFQIGALHLFLAWKNLKLPMRMLTRTQERLELLTSSHELLSKSGPIWPTCPHYGWRPWVNISLQNPCGCGRPCMCVEARASFFCAKAVVHAEAIFSAYNSAATIQCKCFVDINNTDILALETLATSTVREYSNCSVRCLSDDTPSCND